MSTWWRRGPKEAVLESWAAERARELGGRLEKLPPTMGEKHRPDRVFVHPRRPAAYLELKRQGETATLEQEFVLTRLRAEGYVAGWANTREGVEVFLKAAMKPPLVMALGIWQEALKDREVEDDKKRVPSGRRRRGDSGNAALLAGIGASPAVAGGVGGSDRVPR